MLQSKLFTKTRKEVPADEVSKNAQLLIRGGFVHKEMAGVYSYLPLGQRVLDNICNIIREEMNALGGQEITLTALQDKELWEKTGRWSDEVVDNWFKTKLKNDAELGLGFTHEEELTNLMRDHIQSFRDLPVYAYQIQTKFRNETRAKSGIMRGREFLMKDLYSFSSDAQSHGEFYERAKAAYQRIYERLGLRVHLTLASGGTFSAFSHEFQTETEAGEDTIHVCTKCNVAINREVISEYQQCPECGNAEFRETKAVEVGNIFTLGTKFSEALDLKYRDEAGEEHFVFMGSYGIGPTRVMGTIVEVSSDDQGIIWPESVAPFTVHLIELGKSEEVKAAAQKLYADLQKSGVQVLYDERMDKTAGEKFADADLIGIPYRVVVSEKTLGKDSAEVKRRSEQSFSLVKLSEVVKLFKHDE